MNTHTLRVGIDVGSTRHRVAVGLPDGKLIDAPVLGFGRLTALKLGS